MSDDDYNVAWPVRVISDFLTFLPLMAEKVKEVSQCEAVGIRISELGDFPYETYLGFEPAFVAQESSLCLIRNGACIMDELGRPKLDCMCGFVIRGVPDGVVPYTEFGSFMTGGTTALLGDPPLAERMPPNTRDVCNAYGYETVALIPLRDTHGTCWGLLQANSREENRISTEAMERLEELAIWLANKITEAVINTQRELELLLTVPFPDDILATLDTIRNLNKKVVECVTEVTSELRGSKRGT